MNFILKKLKLLIIYSYIPYCTPPCANNGKCVNNNVCNCERTKFIGLLCNEYRQMESIKEMDYLVFILSFVFILCSVGFMIGIFSKKNNKFVKGGNFYYFKKRNKKTKYIY